MKYLTKEAARTHWVIYIKKKDKETEIIYCTSEFEHEGHIQTLTDTGLHVESESCSHVLFDSPDGTKQIGEWHEVWLFEEGVKFE